MWKQITELEVVSNFDCARQNRFRSLETSNQGNKIIQTNNSFFNWLRPRRENFTTTDKFSPKQIKEALTLLNEKLAQQFDNLKAKAKLVWETNDFRACPVL